MATKSVTTTSVPQLPTCHVVICWPDDQLREVSLAVASHKELESHTVSEREGVVELERLVEKLKSDQLSHRLLLLLIGVCDKQTYSQIVSFFSKRVRELSSTFVCLLDTQVSENARKRLELADAGVNMVSSSVEQSDKCVRQVLSYLLTRHQSTSRLSCPECGLDRLGEDDLWHHFPLYHINRQTSIVTCPVCSTSVRNAGQHIHETHGVRKSALSASHKPETFYGFAWVLIHRERDQKFLLVQEFGQLGYFLPAGRVDALESFHKAAIREVKEEVGIEIRLKGILNVSHGRYPGGDMRIQVVFYATPAPSHTEQLPKTTPDYESAGACWVSLEDLHHVKLRGQSVKHWVKYILEGRQIYPLSLLM